MHLSGLCNQWTACCWDACGDLPHKWDAFNSTCFIHRTNNNIGESHISHAENGPFRTRPDPEYSYWCARAKLSAACLVWKQGYTARRISRRRGTFEKSICCQLKTADKKPPPLWNVLFMYRALKSHWWPSFCGYIWNVSFGRLKRYLSKSVDWGNVWAHAFYKLIRIVHFKRFLMFHRTHN